MIFSIGTTLASGCLALQGLFCFQALICFILLKPLSAISNSISNGIVEEQRLTYLRLSKYKSVVMTTEENKIKVAAPVTLSKKSATRKKKNKDSTASKHVHLLDAAFYMPQLNRYRRILIYLPPHYATSQKKYPVLYLQDGQNVFDAATSFSGEWGVDETLDSLPPSVENCIVVAVDNSGEKRLNEYNPYNMKEHGKGEGNAYVDFLATSLKPFVDTHYRTKKSSKHTFIAGSSMGGLIAFYALLKYPKVFGGAGVFSPAFWIAPQLINDVAKLGKKVKGAIYFYAGGKESNTMVADMIAISSCMQKVSKANITTVVQPAGQHTEAAWQQVFPHFYKWLQANKL